MAGMAHGAPDPSAYQRHPGLPVVHVHGATSWRRRALLILVTVLPSLGAFAVGAVAPLEQDVAAGFVPANLWFVMLFAVVATRSFPPLARWGRHVSASLVGVAWAIAGAAMTMQRDAVAWSPAALALVVAATLAGFWVAWWACGLGFGVVGPLVRPSVPPATPTMRTAWSTRASNSGIVILLVALAAFGLVFAVVTAPSSSHLMLAVVAFVLVLLLSSTIRITADRRGLRVRSRILGIPLLTVPLARIASASAALVDEAEWGQIGSTADRELITIIHRSGPALIVTRTDGSMIVVTTDRPDEAAAVLESLRAQPTSTA